ncbi:MAG: carbohydrate-binding protein [Planctomycetota bacterium]
MTPEPDAPGQSLEKLEGRRLLSGVSFSQGVVTVDGNDNSRNEVDVVDYGGYIKVILNNGQDDGWYGKHGVDRIEFEGGSRDDRFEMDSQIDIPVYAEGKAGNDVFETGAGDDTLHGGSGNDRANARSGYDRASEVEQRSGVDAIINPPGGGSGGGSSGGGGSSSGQQPYNGSARPVPGRIQAEHYDNGGQNVAFYDTDPNRDNGGGNFRNTGVDLGRGDSVVGWIRSGEWLEYTTNVQQSGEYRVKLRAASPNNDGSVRVSIDGQTRETRITTDGWSDFDTFDLGTINLSSGQKVLRVTFNATNGDVGDFDWIELERVGGGSTPSNPTPPSNNPSGSQPYGSSPINATDRIQAEHYDRGGQGVAYNDTTSESFGSSSLRGGDRVDINNGGGNTHVGWADTGEWLNYTINVQQAGEYEAIVNAATANWQGSVRIVTEDGDNASRVIDRNGWQNFSEQSLGRISLGSGTQVIRLEFSQPNGGDAANVDYIELRPVNGNNPTPPPPPPPAPPPPPPSNPTPPSNPGTPTPPTSNVRPDARITAVTSTSIMAGMSFHAHALDTSFNVGDEDTARIEWDFGNPGGKYNKITGFNAGHLYENPGSYTVRLTVWNEAGQSDTTTRTVNVTPDSRTTVYVSRWGNDGNSGTSSSSPVRTIERGVERIHQLGNNTKLVLERGHTYDVDTTLQIHLNNVVVGAYGSGQKPTIMWTNPREHWNNKSVFWFDTSKTDFTVRDVTFDSPYGNDTSGYGIPAAIQPSGKNITVYNVTFDDMGDAILGSAAPDGILVLENDVPGTRDLRRYFTWIEGNDWTILGNSVPNSTREHIVRISGGERVNVGDNDFGNIDRRDQGDPYDYAKGVVNVQKGQHAYVWGNRLNGSNGTGPLGDADGLSETWARFRHSVFEGNRVTGSYIIEHGAEHVHLRSNIFDSDDMTAIVVEGYSSTYNRGVVDAHIVNNTIINDGTIGQFARVWAGTDDIALANNLYVAPDLYVGPNGTALLQINANNLNGFSTIENNVWADADYLAWADGLLWVGTGGGNSGFQTKQDWLSFSRVDDDVFANTSLDSQYRPNGVARNAGAQYEGVFVDFYGNWRDSNGQRSVGAVEA